MASEFLNAYIDGMKDSGILPSELDQLDGVLQVFVLEKALYEIGYELGSRPEWVGIPLRGVLDLLEKKSL
ncbi:MAG: hypothetical protein EOP05_20020 [Proteobacteria bacterium]|nr:MAG: hypothetical protein EOP05_20020 [Pseudomonadota bacterium]